LKTNGKRIKAAAGNGFAGPYTAHLHSDVAVFFKIHICFTVCRVKAAGHDGCGVRQKISQKNKRNPDLERGCLRYALGPFITDWSKYINREKSKEET